LYLAISHGIIEPVGQTNVLNLRLIDTKGIQQGISFCFMRKLPSGYILAFKEIKYCEFLSSNIHIMTEYLGKVFLTPNKMIFFDFSFSLLSSKQTLFQLRLDHMLAHFHVATAKVSSVGLRCFQLKCK
jgi:hypothetical protein